MAVIPWNNDSYNTARADILARAASGLGYDFDGYFGYQCWDLGANWYALCGSSFLTANSFTGAGGSDSYVKTCWTYPQAFAHNSADPFMAITNINDIKRGDMIIWGSTIAISGHNAFADEDYNNGKSTILALGQNQVNPSFEVGHIPTLTELSKTGILGAFRFKGWTNGPGPDPQPSPPSGAVIRPKRGGLIIKRLYN